MRALPLLLASVALALAVATPTVHAQRFGSNLRGTPNLAIGADLAPRLDAITGAPTLVPSGQTTCTVRNVGYIGNVRRIGSMVPANGVITRVRIRSGANPAPVRVVIMSGSPGLYGTVIRRTRVFRLRQNGVTTLRVNLPAQRSFSTGNRGRQQIIDAIGLSAVGPGTLPFFDQGTAGTFRAGTGLTQLWYPAMAPNQPRVEGYTTDGLEVLMQWEFRRNRGRQVN